MTSSILCNQISRSLHEVEQDHIFTYNIQLVNFSIYLALICNFVRIPLKHMTNYFDILPDKSILMSPHSLVTSTARDWSAVPVWPLKRKREDELALRSCSTLKRSIKCTPPPWLQRIRVLRSQLRENAI